MVTRKQLLVGMATDCCIRTTRRSRDTGGRRRCYYHCSRRQAGTSTNTTDNVITGDADSTEGETTGTIKAVPKNNDYWTNAGIIEGVWIFSRHGDRTPSRPLTPIHRQTEEAAYWMTKLPIPNTNTIFMQYSHYFPVTIQQQQRQQQHQQRNQPQPQHSFIDVSRNPFGFLTSKGLQQLQYNGRCFYNRYNTYGHHYCSNYNRNTTKTTTTASTSTQNRDSTLLSNWNIKVYSTNYLRTIMSIQSFLDGLFQTQCYPTRNPIASTSVHEQQEETDPTTVLSTSTLTDRLYDPNVTKEEPIPSLDKNHHNTVGHKLVTVQVRDVHHDPLNAFDRNPTLIAKLVSEVMHTTEFSLRDGKAASLAARLANILPGLMRKKSNTNTTTTNATATSTNTSHANASGSSTTTTTTGTKKNGASNDFSRHAPSRINWVEATDHFVCRKAHDVELSKFTDYENQDEYEQTLQALSYPTMAHLTWRFRMWYQHERLLALIAAPPLREITNQMIATPNLLPTEKRPMVLYSCHDITILGLLYAIGADFLSVGSNSSSNNTIENISIPDGDGDDDDDGNVFNDIQDVGTWRYWPSYGSHLVFELVRIHEDGKELQSPGLSKNETHVIRILLDGVPVRSSKINRSSTTNDGSIEGMFTIKSFDELVKNLEDAGGFDYDSLLGKKET